MDNKNKMLLIVESLDAAERFSAIVPDYTACTGDLVLSDDGFCNVIAAASFEFMPACMAQALMEAYDRTEILTVYGKKWEAENGSEN